MEMSLLKKINFKSTRECNEKSIHSNIDDSHKLENFTKVLKDELRI